MIDVKHRLDEIDVLNMPDGWQDIQRRRARTDLPIRIDEPRRSPGGRFGVAVVAFVVFIAAGALLWNGFHTGPSSVAGSESASPTTGLDQYVNPMGIPISVDYPLTWYAQSVSQDANRHPSITGKHQIGLVVSNAPQAMPSPGVATPSPGPLPEDANLPPDFVTVAILFDGGMGIRLPHRPDSPLPLSMNDAKIAPGPADIRILEATVSGFPLTISVQAGPQALRTDLALADDIVASIRPTDVSNASPDTSPLLGTALAEALGLELRDGQPPGCNFYVEVNDPAGYCLDAIGSSKLDRYVVSQELQGRIPSDAERACFSAADRVGNMSNDSPDYQDAEQAMMDACHPASTEASPRP